MITRAYDYRLVDRSGTSTPSSSDDSARRPTSTSFEHVSVTMEDMIPHHGAAIGP